MMSYKVTQFCNFFMLCRVRQTSVTELFMFIIIVMLFALLLMPSFNL